MLDSYYVNKDGKIANEFYVVTETEDGENEFKKVEEGMKKLEDP